MHKMHLPFVACALAQLCASACIPFDQAQRHIGETQCVTGKVLRVEAGAKGVHYLDFCDDFRLCPFSVVVFAYDLKNVGDVRELAGKVVEIRGEVKEYDDRRKSFWRAESSSAEKRPHFRPCRKISMSSSAATSAPANSARLTIAAFGRRKVFRPCP